MSAPLKESRRRPSPYKISEVPYRKGRRDKFSAEPQLQVGGLLVRGFWLPDGMLSGVALHPESASLGHALAGFVTVAGGPRRGNHTSKVSCRRRLSTTQTTGQVRSCRACRERTAFGPPTPRYNEKNDLLVVDLQVRFARYVERFFLTESSTCSRCLFALTSHEFVTVTYARPVAGKLDLGGCQGPAWGDGACAVDAGRASSRGTRTRGTSSLPLERPLFLKWLCDSAPDHSGKMERSRKEKGRGATARAATIASPVVGLSARRM